MQCLHKILASITYNSINKVNANIKYGKLHRALWGNPHPLQTLDMLYGACHVYSGLQALH